MIYSVICLSFTLASKSHLFAFLRTTRSIKAVESEFTVKPLQLLASYAAKGLLSSLRELFVGAHGCAFLPHVCEQLTAVSLEVNDFVLFFPKLRVANLKELVFVGGDLPIPESLQILPLFAASSFPNLKRLSLCLGPQSFEFLDACRGSNFPSLQYLSVSGPTHFDSDSDLYATALRTFSFMPQPQRPVWIKANASLKRFVQELPSPSVVIDIGNNFERTGGRIPLPHNTDWKSGHKAIELAFGRPASSVRFYGLGLWEVLRSEFLVKSPEEYSELFDACYDTDEEQIAALSRRFAPAEPEEGYSLVVPWAVARISSAYLMTLRSRSPKSLSTLITLCCRLLRAIANRSKRSRYFHTYTQEVATFGTNATVLRPPAPELDNTLQQKLLLLLGDSLQYQVALEPLLELLAGNGAVWLLQQMASKVGNCISFAPAIYRCATTSSTSLFASLLPDIPEPILERLLTTAAPGSSSGGTMFAEATKQCLKPGGAHSVFFKVLSDCFLRLWTSGTKGWSSVLDLLLLSPAAKEGIALPKQITMDMMYRMLADEATSAKFARLIRDAHQLILSPEIGKHLGNGRWSPGRLKKFVIASAGHFGRSPGGPVWTPEDEVRLLDLFWIHGILKATQWNVDELLKLALEYSDVIPSSIQGALCAKSSFPFEEEALQLVARALQRSGLQKNLSPLLASQNFADRGSPGFMFSPSPLNSL